MSQQEIEDEKKKLAAIIAEKEAWEKWDNSILRVMQKTVKELEEMGEQPKGVCRDASIIITKTIAKETAANNSIQDDISKPISGGYDGVKMSNEADNNNNNDNI